MSNRLQSCTLTHMLIANPFTVWLLSALFFFAAGQVFNFVISPYICNGTGGKIDGSLFETLFTLVSVVLIWRFWTTITEVEWPSGNGGVYNEQGASYPASSGFA